MSSTSFTKKARVKIGQIPGTKPSFYNNQLLISTGIPSLDVVIGGGLGVGTIFLLEEDLYGNYARLMMKYFAAEAILTQQSVILSSVESQQLIKELPSPAEDSKPKYASKEEAEAAIENLKCFAQQHTKGDAFFGVIAQAEHKVCTSSEKMKIAWRYENKPKVEPSSSSHTFGHYYDLTKTMDEERVTQSDIALSTSPIELKESYNLSPISGINFRYCRLLQEIREKVSAGGFSISQESPKRNILRIGIHSLGSPMWGENPGTRTYDPSLALFLIALRALLRSSFAVAFVTMPSHLFEDQTFLHRIVSLGDTVVKLESFAGSEREKNPIFKEYHGLFHVVHLPRLNSIVPPQRDTADLAFKLRRKKFSIEKLHLPPELADSTGRSQEDDDPLFSKRASSGCGSSTSSKLDF